MTTIIMMIDALKKGFSHVCFLAVLLCCSYYNKSDSGNTHQSGNKKLSFQPDTTVNNKLILRDPNSVPNFAPGTEIHLVDLVRKFPVAFFCNKDTTQYLAVYKFYGDIKDQFSRFEIGYYSQKLDSFELLSTDYPTFFTESELELGMTLDELVQKKGTNYTINDSIIRYEIENMSTSSFLKRFNSYSYFLECKIEGNQVKKMRYGFSYP